MTTQEAFAAIALAAVACDGRLGRDEAHALRCQLEYRSLYSDSSDAAMGQLFDRLLLLLRDQGVDGLIASALPQLNARQQQSALAVAAHLVHADRRVTPEETEFLDQLTSQMSLPVNEARMVVQAIEALNRDMLDS
ncbi:hypothetical protein [Synechococcus sp. MU1625]|uniref:hypothetical protein n=1 Tax=Synechococcus sp. MU1625 TaxID=2508347 RepID=UPI001CF8404C|nr:hypothetical protein [Synechococcus sp. MU1625]MCB4398908.1 hypothetical protein [Synechococcus sp. MU1625]